MNRFEQLIEYVINDEDAKARELFHDIVVEKFAGFRLFVIDYIFNQLFKTVHMGNSYR